MSRRNPPNIEIYSMMHTPDGGATIHEGHDTEPDFYDVIVRYDGDDPLDESEDHPTFAEAMAAAVEFQKKYPDSDIEEISG